MTKDSNSAAVAIVKWRIKPPGKKAKQNGDQFDINLSGRFASEMEPLKKHNQENIGKKNQINQRKG